MTPMTGPQALDRHFLEIRCRLLDLAASLDRIGRGGDTSKTEGDPRLDRVRQALEVLQDQSDGRAERIQQIFSLEYDPAWKKPKPK
jgi:hypothetical protein